MSAPAWKILLSDVVGDDELVAAAATAVASGWWSMGPRVGELEEHFATFCGSRHAVAVANGTAALHLGLLALGCGPGDEVILTSLNFVAAANVVRHVGATPVFCDIVGERELNMDPADLERAITPATKCVVVMHYGGWSCDMDAIGAIAARHGIAVLEDAAHAPGAHFGARPCGTLGAIGCFSFFSNKNLPIGEGGMMVTDDDDLAASLRLLRSHGMTTLTWDRHRGHAHSYDVVMPGFNYRLDEIRAAMALVQLERLPAANAERSRLAELYRGRLDGISGLAVPFEDASFERRSSNHLCVVVLPAGIDRSGLRATMAQAGIQTSVHYPPIHRFTAYEDLGRRRPLPQTDRVADRILTLPLSPQLRDEQLDAVVEVLLSNLGRAGAEVAEPRATLAL